MPVTPESVARILVDEPSLTAVEIAARIQGLHPGATKSEVGLAIQRERGWFVASSTSPPKWTLAKFAVARVAQSPPARSQPALPPPYRWQVEALHEWKAQRRRGVVEAVTGTGKTRLGLMAASEAFASGIKVVVIVPRVNLVEQWMMQLATAFPHARIGQFGTRRQDPFKPLDILVATVQSAYRARLVKPGTPALLIADECHHYGSKEWRRVLDEHYEWRLGLTATFASSDEGLHKYLEPFFGRPCFNIGYRRAIDEGVVSHFALTMIGVRFSRGEQTRFDSADGIASSARSMLINRYGVVPEPFGEFMAQVQSLAREMPFTQPGRMAQRYLKAFAERREILGSAKAKYDAINHLSATLRKAHGSIVFTATIDAAEQIAAILRAQGVHAHATHSEVTPADRAVQLERFRDRDIDTLVAPTVLDEGVDVPDADLAIIAAASSSRRQMIQRMGRILRRKDDDRVAQMVILFVEGTPEDPSLGAHEAFLEEVTSVADSCTIFRSQQPSQAAHSAIDERRRSPSPPAQCPHCSMLVSAKPGRHAAVRGTLWHINCWTAARAALD